MSENQNEKIWKSLFKIVDFLRFQAGKNNHQELKKITIGKIRVLSCLFCKSGKPLMVKEIAKKFNITSGAVSQNVDALFKDGLVERYISESDRRAVCIRLSAKGEKIRKTLDYGFNLSTTKLLENIDPEKQKIFLEVLQQIVNKTGDFYEHE